MALSTAQLSLIEQRVTNDGPNAVVAYLFWFFLGLVSGHRFYLGRPGSAILQILSYFIIVGFIWLLVDAFLIPGMIRQKQEELRQRLMTNMMAHGTAGVAAAPELTPEPARLDAAPATPAQIVS